MWRYNIIITEYFHKPCKTLRGLDTCAALVRRRCTFRHILGCCFLFCLISQGLTGPIGAQGPEGKQGPVVCRKLASKFHSLSKQ